MTTLSNIISWAKDEYVNVLAHELNITISDQALDNEPRSFFQALKEKLGFVRTAAENM